MCSTRRENTARFHLQEVLRIVTSIESESTLADAGGGGEGRGGGEGGLRFNEDRVSL